MTDRELSFLKEHFEGEALDCAIARVENGEPLAYVIGEWYFWDDTFKLNTACLIPRPDTEHLVEHGLKHTREGDRIADLCCGSGCIGLSVLKHTKDTVCTFVDISEDALAMTKLNAGRMGLTHRCRFICQDILKDRVEGDFDVILSNPPYIQSEVVSALEVTKHEPRIALDGGSDGMDFYRVLVRDYDPRVMILEIGYDEEDAIKALCDCEVYRDYGGNPRVAVKMQNAQCKMQN
ncbi:MAG: peptide chain release factor N(5)-glutamine methyltransferase [Clostridia bacterium]|nr:peptide chain release factor N(5)-glutamine methyltransferase [Clostridia bacterium]